MQGHFYDPLHGGCLRRVRSVGAGAYRIDGVYGDDEAPLTWRAWHATARVEGCTAAAWTLLVDFHGKERPTRFATATYEPSKGRICWDDGNVWKRLFTHPVQLR